MPIIETDKGNLIRATEGTITCMFGEYRTHRYTWTDDFNGLTNPPHGTGVNFIMLNPSNANEFGPDPTIRRCVGYAKLWGFDSITVTNLFALVSTQPTALKTHPTPVGIFNDDYLLQVAAYAEKIILAWGAIGTYQDRADQVMYLLRRHRQKMYYLKRTNGGQPGHPLYLPKTLEPQKVTGWDDKEGLS